MQDYQKRMIDEHSSLIVRINKLHNYIYSDASANDDKVEFANKCIQLAAMKKYEECLAARLENTGIVFEEGNYFEQVATLNRTIEVPEESTTAGSDYDVDSEKNAKSE